MAENKNKSKGFFGFIKRILTLIFVDGLSGMALGLFSTLIVGTIVEQAGLLIGGGIGTVLYNIGKVAMALTGAGIGCGVAYKLKQSGLVIFSAATAGMVGAFAGKIAAGSTIIESGVLLSGPGEPLGAFVAAMVTIAVGALISGKTKLDIVLTPLACILSGSVVGLLIGDSISSFMKMIGSMINWGAVQQPVLMGIIVAVLMGMALTLPISSAAIGVMLGLEGIAAGAAVVGCCANMVGFAVASFRDNKFGGLLAQGIGTSMLQMPNIVRKPIIWIPAILTSAILGPISAVTGMICNAKGSGMGSAGLVGQLMTFQEMTARGDGVIFTVVMILLLQFVLPAVLAFAISEVMRKLKWIKPGDMKLDSI